VDEPALSVGFEQMCAETELEDEEAKDFIQRQRSKWKELARHPDRIDIVLERMLGHFLEYPDPNGFKAQLVPVDRKACALYKTALDSKLATRGLTPEWSDVIISGAQNSEPEVARFEYPKAKQDELIDYFKLTPTEWEAWNRERHGEHSTGDSSSRRTTCSGIL
jgi:type I restriction enzyme, R subunit